MMKYFSAIVAAIMATSISRVVMAADIYPDIQSRYAFIVIEGEIERGDYEAFIELIYEGQGNFSNVLLMTPGGDFEEAMKIGRAIRALELGTAVPSFDDQGGPMCVLIEPKDQRNCTCASACFFIHVGSVSRSGLYLGVHRPYFDPARFGKLSRTEAQSAFSKLQEIARVYLNEMEVPADVQEKLFNTPSDKILVLDEETVRTHFLGKLPYLDEWTRGRCAVMSLQQRSLAEELKNKVRKGSASNSEYSKLSELYDLERQENECAIEEMRVARIAAYKNFFGEVPADYKNHDFSNWPKAVALLGRPYHELERLGFVRNQTSYNSNWLDRTASTSEPAMSAADIGAARSGVVGKILVFGPQNPSDGFVDRVFQELSEAWGNPDMVEEDEVKKVWVWTKESFRAELKLEHFLDGRLMHLGISGRSS